MYILYNITFYIITSRSLQYGNSSPRRKEVHLRELCFIKMCKMHFSLYLIIVIGAEINGHERQPDDTRRVHGESDVLGLVEIFRYFSRLEGVQSAHEDENHVVDEGHHEGERRDPTSQHRGQRLRINFLYVGRLNYQPNDSANQLRRCNTYIMKRITFYGQWQFISYPYYIKYKIAEARRWFTK